jgi:hypothetical protein
VSAALTAWVAGLLPGQALLPTDLIRACFGAQPNYTAIAGLTDLVITTPAAPLAATATQIIRISGTPTLVQGTL